MPKYVIKRNKKKEKFDPQKIIKTLENLKLNQEKIAYILREIEKSLPEVVTTKELFKFVYDLLKKEKESLAYKFNLKQALTRLGPSGYPFEKFISHLLRLYGYNTKHNVFLEGKCLTYEIDFLAEKDVVYLGECKYHFSLNKKNDIKTILYSYARFLDIRENFKKEIKLWLVTNTRFTFEGIKFASCYDIKLLSWDYPKDESLKFLIENKKVYPLTIFDFLSNKTLQNLFQYDIVLLSDFLEKDENYLKKISGLKIEDIISLKNKIRDII